MATYQLTTRNDLPAYSYSVQLEGQTYQLAFQFNDRMARWTISCLDEAGNVLVSQVPLIVNYPLFDRYKIEGLPPGTFWAFDTAGTNTDPGRYDLSVRVILLYQESA